MSMGRYVLKRLIWALLATYLILSVYFGLLYISPDPQATQLGFEAASAGQQPDAAVEAHQRVTGVSGSLWTQYTTYMTNMVTLNWGWSDYRSQPVMTAIVQAYPYSLAYGLPATILAVVLGFAIGLYSATHQYSITDHIATFFAFFGISVPNFWLAIILLLLFSNWLGLVPTYYHSDVPLLSMQNAIQLILPVVVLGTSAIAGQMRYTRAESLEYVNAAFIQAARASGASEWSILRYIFRAASVPLATILVGDLLGLLFVASYLIEVVFQIPGLGLLSFRAITHQDTSLVLATALIPVLIGIVGNLAQDIAYTVLDPRIDYEDRQ